MEGIRKATKKDLDEITRLHMQLVEVLKRGKPNFYRINPQEKKIFKKSTIKKLKSKKSLVVVYEKENKIIAYAIANIKEQLSFCNGKMYGEGAEIVIDKRERKKGISLKVMNYIINFFRSKKINLFEVVIDSKNKTSLDVWSKRGFKEELKLFYKKI
jgi:L-amino acid N-acyltransferase YncA